MSVTTDEPGGAAEIRPFRVEVPEEDLVELRRRVQAVRWPENETVTDPSQGVQLATMQALAHYWGSDYDLRRFEARLKREWRFWKGRISLALSTVVLMTTSVVGGGADQRSDRNGRKPEVGAGDLRRDGYHRYAIAPSTRLVTSLRS